MHTNEDEYKEVLTNPSDYDLSELQAACHESSKAHGWWDAPEDVPMLTHIEQQTGVKIALIHSEVSEALEGFRKGIPDKHLPHRSNFEVELADAVIRILDLAGAHGMDVMGAIAEKMQVNWERADHKPEARAAAHGKKF